MNILSAYMFTVNAVHTLHPVLVSLLTQAGLMVGGELLSGLFGTPESARFQGMIGQQQGLTQQYQQNLQQALAGKPTPMTQQIGRQVQRQFRGARQATAASASRMGQEGTAVSRARQERLGVAAGEMTSQALAQHYMGAMQQAGGIQAQTLVAQQQLAAQEQSAMERIMGALSRSIGDAMTRELLGKIIAGFGQGAGVGGNGTMGIPVAPPSAPLDLPMAPDYTTSGIMPGSRTGARSWIP